VCCFVLNNSVLVNEGATPGWNGLYHYYHFTLEDTLGGFAGGALAQPEPLTPSRLAVPWGNDWHDQWHMNDAVTASLFGENIIDKDMWAGLADKPLFFDKRESGRGFRPFLLLGLDNADLSSVIFVDRWAAHRNSKLVEVWHKMPVQVFETLITRPGSSHFFDKPRQQLLDYFAIPPAPAGKQVRIAYIDRQSSNRKIPEDQHMTLVAEMKSLADSRGAHFAHLVLEDMTPDEQFREVAQANVMIGIHGNGLTHLIWLQSGAAVIEMFPQNVFQRDYQTAAAVLGFNYTGIVSHLKGFLCLFGLLTPFQVRRQDHHAGTVGGGPGEQERRRPAERHAGERE
jgi:hypothetical protein